MAITAHFSADFADFYSKVLTAETQLEGLTKTSEQVGASLQRMVDSFSGSRLIQQATLTAEAIDRIGGVSKLTADEVQKAATLAAQAMEKAAATGTTIPAAVRDLAALKTETQELASATTSFGSIASNVFGSLAGYIAGAFTVGAVVSFGKSILDLADSIQKTALQTGMTYTEVQRLMHISDQTSVSMSTLTSASQTLSEALGSGDAGVAGAVKALGFNLEQLKAMSPYEQMIALADAIMKIEDPLKRAAAARDVFGKNWKEMMAAIMAGMGDTGKAASLMADDATDAANRFKNAMSSMWTAVQVNIGNMIGDLQRGAPIISAYIDAFRGISGIKEATTAVQQHAGALQSQLIPAVQQVTLSDKQRKTALDDVIASADAAIKQLKPQVEAEEKLARALEEYNSAGKTTAETLAGMNAAMIEGIRYGLERGVAMSNLAIIYGATDVQIKAVSTSMKEYAATLKQVQDIEKGHYNLSEIQAWSATATAASKDVMEKELASITARENALKAMHERQLARTKELSDAQNQAGMSQNAILQQTFDEITKTADVQKAEAARIRDSEMERVKGVATSLEMLQQLQADVTETYNMSIEAIKNHADKAMEAARKAAQTAKTALNEVKDAIDAFAYRPDLIPTSESLTAAAYRPGSFLGLGSGPMVQSMIQSAASMPWDIRTGAAGVSIQSGAITMNYPIMNDPNAMDQLAKIVGDAVMSRLTRTGGGY